MIYSVLEIMPLCELPFKEILSVAVFLLKVKLEEKFILYHKTNISKRPSGRESDMTDHFQALTKVV